MATSNGKRNVTVGRWSVRLSVCLSRRHTHRDSSSGSMRRGQRTFRTDNEEGRHTCFQLSSVVLKRDFEGIKRYRASRGTSARAKIRRSA